MRLYLEDAAQLADGARGQLADVIVDPASRHATYLVVSVAGHLRSTHLVPIEALTSRDGVPTLSWSSARVEHAPKVTDVDFVDLESWPHVDEGWDVGVIRMPAAPSGPSIWPDGAGSAPGHGPLPGPRFAGGPAAATLFDRIPVGTAELRRDSIVISSDDHLIGHVQALVLDVRYAITHVILDAGHLWGHRDISIPIADVTHVDTDRVQLRVPREAVVGYGAQRHHRRHDHDADQPAIEPSSRELADRHIREDVAHARPLSPVNAQTKNRWS